jgi:predicted nucleic acid-binding protein
MGRRGAPGIVIARYLVDKSVWARMTKPAVREAIVPLADRGLLATCGAVEMEMLYSARNTEDRDRIRGWLRAFEWLPTNDETWQKAIDVQCDLIVKGNHRAVSLPDLLVAATADRHGVTVLHYDGDYDLIAGVTGQQCQWVVDPGTAD